LTLKIETKAKIKEISVALKIKIIYTYCAM